MTAQDLPTVGYLDQWFRAILARVEQDPGAPAARALAVPAPEVVLYRLKVGKPSRDDPANP